MKKKQDTNISKEIILKSQEGDISAFEQIVFFYEKRVFYYCKRYISVKEDVEDMTQEIFLKLFKQIKKYNFSSSFSTWLYTISKNTVYDFLRRKRRYKELFIDVDITLVEAKARLSWEKMNTISNKIDVEIALAKIKPKHRQAIRLFYWSGLGYKEIAKVMKIPINTVKTYISRAKISIASHLKSEKK